MIPDIFQCQSWLESNVKQIFLRIGSLMKPWSTCFILFWCTLLRSLEKDQASLRWCQYSYCYRHQKQPGYSESRKRSETSPSRFRYVVDPHYYESSTVALDLVYLAPSIWLRACLLIGTRNNNAFRDWKLSVRPVSGTNRASKMLQTSMQCWPVPVLPTFGRYLFVLLKREKIGLQRKSEAFLGLVWCSIADRRNWHLLSND